MTGLALLANPASGSGDAERVGQLLAAREPGLARFGLDEADAVAAAAPERIVVTGGDGSIGCAARAAATLGVPLAIVPVGTANDFARAIGIPGDLEPAVELALSGTRTRRAELGEARDGRGDARPFVNAVSAGLSPIAAAEAGGLKATLGKLAYSLAALRVGLRARPVECAVRCDGEELFSGSTWQAIVACSGAFGGGASVEADPDDGLLDVVVIAAGPRGRLPLYAYGLRYGQVERQHGVSTGSAAAIEIESRGGPGFNVDGELVEAEGLRCATRPGGFEVVVG